MLTKLLQALGTRRAAPQRIPLSAPSVAQPPEQVTVRPVPAGMPVYPPVDKGVLFDPEENVVESQAAMIRRLKLLAGESQDVFDSQYRAVLSSLADYVHLLPASESGTHMGAGGLFRLALEIAFFSRQACEGVLFAGRAGVESRRDLEPRWRYATFLAGLCCELHRPLSRMIVVTERGQEWPIHRIGLSEWLREVGETRYFIRWVKEGNDFATASATLLATKIVPESALQYLQEGHPSIIPSMLEAIAGDASRTKENRIADTIGRMRRRVLERDQMLAPQNYGKFTVGSQLEPHLIDAMRQLVANGTWQINQKRARIWYGKDGLFIVWRTAAKEMIEALDKASVVGIPRDATTIAEVLLRANVFAADKKGDLYWKIRTPLSDGDLVAVRVANPETLLVAIEDEDRPDPLSVALDAEKNVELSMPSPTEPPSPKPTPATAERVASDTPTGTDAPVEAPSIAMPTAPKAPVALQCGKGSSTEKKPLRVKPEHQEEFLHPGAIAPVAAIKAGDVVMPADVAARMTPLTREVVCQAVREYRAGKLADVSTRNDRGIAVSLEQMGSYGTDLTKLLTELHGLGWLYIDPDKPTRKLHSVKIGGKAIQSMVLKEQVARDMGFID
jgi:conjugal transfer pilus assembly protein TraI